MTDDLRTRIAAAIESVDDWRGVTDPAILADAVIEELKKMGVIEEPPAVAGCDR